MPLNYLTCKKNGAIEMQHNNNLITNIYYNCVFISLDMHPLAAASRSRLLETKPKLFTMCSVDDIALNLSLRKSKRQYS